ncbi:hypothetical protein CRYUN_Cryun35bG0019400 [Craigia yunnanensis]
MATGCMEEYLYNKQQKHRKNNVLLCRIVLTLVLFFWLSTHFDIAKAIYQEFIAVSNKPLPIFIFMNFIIFALCFLSNQKPMIQQPYVVYHENVGSNRGSPDIGDSHLEEEHTEEILVDKHIILVENAVGKIVGVSSDNSDSFERNHNQLEFRRLERGMSKELVITVIEPPWRSMDDMSNEEFRFAVEAFIAERNTVMMQENNHDEEGIRFLISTSY